MKTKKTLILIFLFLFMFSLDVYAQDDEINVIVDDEVVEFTSLSGKPFIDDNNRTQVPLRITLEAFGATVKWNNTERCVELIKDDVTVKVPIGIKEIYVNDKMQKIDTEAIIKDNKTYLPIRAIIEAFGAEVEWDGKNKTIYINSTIKINDEKYNFDMYGQEGNFSNYSYMVFDENYSYHIVDFDEKSNNIRIMRRNRSNGLVDIIYYVKGDASIEQLYLFNNCLYFIESKGFGTRDIEFLIKKIDLKTLVETEVYSNNEIIDTFTIYNNELYVENSSISNDCEKFYFEIGKVVSKHSIESIVSGEGIVNNIQIFDNKMYYDNYSKIYMFDLSNNSNKEILNLVQVYTIVKDNIYYTDINNNVFKAKLPEIKNKRLLYRMDKSKFTNSQAAIKNINYYDNNLYFTISPNWCVYKLLPNGEIEVHSYIHTHPSKYALLDDFVFYEYNYCSKISYDSTVGGKGIYVKNNAYISEWLNGKDIYSSDDEEAENSEERDENKKLHSIFNLTDDEVNEAIKNGKKGVTNVLELMSNYCLEPSIKSDYDILIDNININTPYLYIMQSVVVSGGEHASDEEIQNNVEKIIDVFSNEYIDFTMVYNTDSYENPKFLEVVIEQDGKFYYPTVSFANSRPKRTSTWPNFPAYQARVDIIYDNNADNKIDLTKSAKLIIYHVIGSDLKSTYTIDFSKIK